MNKNKTYKESNNLRTAHNRGVSFSDWLDIFKYTTMKSSFPLFDSEQLAMFIQVIPCPRLNIKRKFCVKTTDVTRPIYNLDLYKTTNNPICNIKALGAGLLSNIKLENIFFVWCEILKIHNTSLSKFEIADLVIDDTDYPQNNWRNQKGTRSEKSNGDPLAIIVYKCCDSKCIKPFYRCKKDASHKKNYRENILRLQLKDLCPISKIHSSLINILYTSNRHR
jgi:hypothetical protein